MSAIAASQRLAPMRLWVLALLIGVALVGVAGVAALVAWALGPAAVRAWLGFSFTGIPDELREVGAILANNARILAALLVACVAVGWARDARLSADSPETHGRVAAAFGVFLVCVCDAFIGGLAVVHAVIIGVGGAAYGDEMVAALVPHGPIELVAYSLALAVYVEVRRRPVERRRILAIAAIAFAGLALAAPLEVYVGT